MSGAQRDSLVRYGKLQQRLLESFGLQFGPGSKEMAAAVRTRMRTLRLARPAYQDLLDGPTGTEELFKLAGELSVGQMVFNDEHLLAVSKRFLRPLLRSRLANRPEGSKPSLKIWSVGCACGDKTIFEQCRTKAFFLSSASSSPDIVHTHEGMASG